MAHGSLEGNTPTQNHKLVPGVVYGRPEFFTLNESVKRRIRTYLQANKILLEDVSEIRFDERNRALIRTIVRDEDGRISLKDGETYFRNEESNIGLSWIEANT